MAPPDLEFSSLCTSPKAAEAEGRLRFLVGLTGGKVDAPDEKLNFLNKVLKVPLDVEVVDDDGGGGTTGFDDESGREGCDWDNDDKGPSEHDDGDEYDLATAEPGEDDSHPPGRGDEDDMDKKCDMDSDIDILLVLFFRPIDDDDPATAEPEPEPKLELTLEAEPGVEETNDGSSIFSIPSCFPTTLPNVDKAGVKYSVDPAPELDNELGLSTVRGGSDDVEKTREVGDDRGETALIDDRPLASTPHSPLSALSATRFLGGTGNDGSSYSGDRAILHSNPPKLALRPGLGIGTGILMLPLLLSKSAIRGKGEVALRLGSSRYKPTFEGRPREKPFICVGR